MHVTSRAHMGVRAAACESEQMCMGVRVPPLRCGRLQAYAHVSVCTVPLCFTELTTPSQCASRSPDH
eukprot:55145-Pleurochrysis_carterae.AAC.2